jgi:hypothetical protein
MLKSKHPEKILRGWVRVWDVWRFALAGHPQPADFGAGKHPALVRRSDAVRAWMKREYDELFLPADLKWRVKAWHDARTAFERDL